MQWIVGHPNVASSIVDRPMSGRPLLARLRFAGGHRPVPPSRWARFRLRRAALRYAANGWPVTPGACFVGNRFACGRPGCPTVACHPALESWEDAASTDREQVERWWARRPHAVLLATGYRFDAIEVPAGLGLRALGALRLHEAVLGAQSSDASAARGPVAVTDGGRWMFLVRSGTPLRPELGRRLDVVRHGRGSWIPAAPSRTTEGPVRWVVAPEEADWHLPDAAVVQALLAEVLAADAKASALTVDTPAGDAETGNMVELPRQQAVKNPAERPVIWSSEEGDRRPPAIPRQLSTLRRAA